MKRIERVLLVCILVIAGVLRFVGTNPGYNKYHSDEGISYSAAVSMIKNESLDPLRYDYPAVTPLVNYLTFRAIFIPIAWEKYYLTHLGEIVDGKLKLPLDSESYKRVFQVEILGEREVNAIFWGRYTTALLSLGSVWLVYLLGKKLFGKWVGIMAAMFLAVNFRSVTNAHIGLPDTYNAFFLLLSLVLSAQLFVKRKKREYLLAGVGVGLSMAVKYQFFGIFPLLLAHFWAGKVGWRKKMVDAKFMMAFAAAGFVFVLVNPYALIKLEETLGWLSLINIKYAMGRKILNVYAVSYLYHIAIGSVIVGLILVGLVRGVFSKWRGVIFLFCFLVPFMYMTLYYSNGGFYVRNFVTVMPLLMLLAALGYVALVNLVKPGSMRAVVVAASLPVVLWPSLINSAINSYFYTKPWNYDLILSGATEKLEEGDVVVAHPFDPLPAYVERMPFLAEERYSLAEFREDGADYALVNMDWAANNFYGWMNTDFNEGLKYWNKPYEKLRNTFWGISIEEMMDCVVVSAYKPWQAPEADLFLVGVPDHAGLVYEKVSGEESDLLEFESGYVYKISVDVTSDQEVSKQTRKAFVKLQLENGDSHVSARYWGVGKKTLDVYFAPEISVGGEIGLAYSGITNEEYEMNNVVVYRSVERYDRDSECQSVSYEEYKDLLYPYSHGNL